VFSASQALQKRLERPAPEQAVLLTKDKLVYRSTEKTNMTLKSEEDNPDRYAKGTGTTDVDDSDDDITKRGVAGGE